MLESQLGNKVTTEEECAEYSEMGCEQFSRMAEWCEFHDSTDLLDGKSGEALIKQVVFHCM